MWRPMVWLIKKFTGYSKVLYVLGFFLIKFVSCRMTFCWNDRITCVPLCFSICFDLTGHWGLFMFSLGREHNLSLLAFSVGHMNRRVNRSVPLMYYPISPPHVLYWLPSIPVWCSLICFMAWASTHLCFHGEIKVVGAPFSAASPQTSVSFLSSFSPSFHSCHITEEVPSVSRISPYLLYHFPPPISLYLSLSSVFLSTALLSQAPTHSPPSLARSLSHTPLLCSKSVQSGFSKD